MIRTSMTSVSPVARPAVGGAAGPWLGVDVGGERKGFDVALVDDHALLALLRRQRVEDVVALVHESPPSVVAIDSPCGPAPDGATSREGERALAKAVCGIRWTPDAARLSAGTYYGWVRCGFALYDALRRDGVEPVECFPTASWTRWLGGRGSLRRSAWTTAGLPRLGLSGLPARTNQDGRDAIAAAVTARQVARGETEAFGGIHVPLGPLA